MDRRSFLKSISATLAGIMAPPMALAATTPDEALRAIRVVDNGKITPEKLLACTMLYLDERLAETHIKDMFLRLRDSNGGSPMSELMAANMFGAKVDISNEYLSKATMMDAANDVCKPAANLIVTELSRDLKSASSLICYRAPQRSSVWQARHLDSDALSLRLLNDTDPRHPEDIIYRFDFMVADAHAKPITE